MNIENTPDLRALLKRVNNNHAAILKSEKTSLQLALEIGNDLLKAKQALTHGAWEPWISENCKFTADMARKYVRIAKIDARKPGTCSGFEGGIAAFLKEHAEPRAQRDDAASAPALEAAAPKAATVSESVSEAAPSPIADKLTPDQEEHLARVLSKEEAPTVPPRLQETFNADLKALRTWQKETGADELLDLIAHTRAAVRRALVAGQTLASPAQLTTLVRRSMRREDITEQAVISAYVRGLELQQPGGPLCIFATPVAKPATKADFAKMNVHMSSFKKRSAEESAALRAKHAALPKTDEDAIQELELMEFEP